MNNLEKLEQQVKDMQAEIERLKKQGEEVRPLFPKGRAYAVYTDGDTKIASMSIAGIARQGSTSATKEGAEKISAQRAARAYCLEAINQANRGDNGFKPNERNVLNGWHHNEKKIMTDFAGSFQSEESGWYIRSEGEAERLQNNPEYVKNFKIAKGVE